MSNLPVYRYFPLPDVKACIRLLEIFQGANHEHIHGAIRIYNIGESPPFIALSYAWGNEPLTEFMVTDSAKNYHLSSPYKGLHSIRDVVRPSWLWVDAICIHQANEIEKAGQISLMAKIYSNATKVIVWLGPAFNGSDRLLHELPSLVETVKHIDGHVFIDRLETYGLPQRYDPLWSSLAEFMSLTWFRRLWFLEVTEPVDRVYGSFGLMKDAIQRIPVDYSANGRKAFWKVYIEVATLLLENSLDVLNEAESTHRPPQLPTFVPDWHSRHPNSERFPLIFTAGIVESSQDFPSSVAIVGEALSVRGLLVGEIADTLPSYTPALNGTSNDFGPDGNAARILKVIEDASSKYKQYWPLVSSEAMAASLARAWKMNALYRSETESFQQYTGDIREDFLFVLKYLEWRKTGNLDIEVTRESAERHLLPYMTHLRQINVGRRFIVTREGKIGLASQSCKPGDSVCIFLEAKNPHILRKVENQDAFELIGAAYVDGMMDGEALSASVANRLQNLKII